MLTSKKTWMIFGELTILCIFLEYRAMYRIAEFEQTVLKSVKNSMFCRFTLSHLILFYSEARDRSELQVRAACSTIIVPHQTNIIIIK